ncbi:hypothetical protein GCM10017709_08680 [Glutamicibacter nicotianae]|uniref:Uncharacterized protein n=2 Tax=Glutamicibacter nicotianae TaxID=37929 RepID=A0ABQ0RKN1_GLUNI|nr:hypothetical protein ANI01nite_12930 [Glutamicibacter nicotianae]
MIRKTLTRIAMSASALALAAGGLTVAAMPAQAGYSYLYPTDYKTFDACNAKRLTMNSSWTRASQCFIYYDTDRNGNRVGPNIWKFSVTIKSY